MKFSSSDYIDLVSGNVNFNSNTDQLTLVDHLGGFNPTGNNPLLAQLAKQKYTGKIFTQYIMSEEIKQNYPTLNLNFSVELQDDINFKKLSNYTIHPTIDLKNFICSFNGTPHVSRKLLVSILKKFGYFNSEYCSKNFSYTAEILDGHIQDFVGDKDNFYLKFFIDKNSEEFFQSVNSFGHVRFNHNKNIYNLESKLTESFLHIVSETMATSYHPFITEKFLYSIVTRGLFLAYAQPGWHEHVEKYYGFKKYNKLFDYRFDTIQDPVERLVELITMVSKFSKLSVLEWKELYEIERDTIEYNYNHYFSKTYLEYLQQYDN